ncbi:protein Asterix [Cladorrhinum sp. PSN332]|nr:protein Asterix [Cladorrhinum sp. PSN332]
MEFKRGEKDVRRPDLIVPYQEPAPRSDGGEFQSTLSSTLPMAAIFMRNRYVGWAAVVFSVQTWLGESEETKKSNSSPGYFSVGMSIMSLIVTYLPLFMPPPNNLQQGSATGAPAPVPA